MATIIATATQVKNNFGRYLEMVLKGNEVIITRKGKEAARLIPRNEAAGFLTDSLKGVLKEDHDLDQEKERALGDKYALSDRR